MLIADLHVHSKYSRACSPEMEPAGLERWCRLKGIDVVGTGDFVHPHYYKELISQLEQAEEGLYRLRAAKDSPVRFLCSVEIALIYKDGARTRKIHHLLLAPSLETAGRIGARLKRAGTVDADGRPIFGLHSRELLEIALEASPRCLLIPAHAWTPWFSIFGSKSGYDSIEECFGPLARYIRAVETGLSSDRTMNDRLSALDGVALVSNSDAHSPSKLGREANALECGRSYAEIVEALCSRDPARFPYTIEFFPEEGKYHFDGHRACRVCLHPRQSREYGLKCPSCRKPLTLGVMHRVEELADRPWDWRRPAGSTEQRQVVPLEELIADAFDCGVHTKRVREEYLKIVAEGGSEFAVLLWRSAEELRRLCPPRVAEAVLRMRRGELHIAPGYDGEFGRIAIFRQVGKDFAVAGGVQMKLL